jgi:hypothetical protein
MEEQTTTTKKYLAANVVTYNVDTYRNIQSRVQEQNSQQDVVTGNGSWQTPLESIPV